MTFEKQQRKKYPAVKARRNVKRDVDPKILLQRIVDKVNNEVAVLEDNRDGLSFAEQKALVEYGKFVTMVVRELRAEAKDMDLANLTDDELDKLMPEALRIEKEMRKGKSE